MRIGTLIAKKPSGKWDFIEVGGDIDGMKNKAKEMKINEAKGEYIEVRFSTSYNKKYKLKPADKKPAKKAEKK